MLQYLTDMKAFISDRTAMEYRPNSGPEQSTPISPEDLNRALQEHCIMHRSLIRWEGPRHAYFTTFSARLFSFDSTWSRVGRPTTVALIAAGFFYVGKYLQLLQTWESRLMFQFLYIRITLQVGDRRQDRLFPLWRRPQGLVRHAWTLNTPDGFHTKYTSGTLRDNNRIVNTTCTLV
jgi:hypothetical protein